MPGRAAPAGGLLVIGDVVTDVVVRPRGQLSDGGPDGAAYIRVRAGGSGANTACWAARFGADVRFLGRAGADGAGWHTEELAGAGVRPHVRIDPDAPTAVVIALIDASGERSMLTDRGAGERLGPGDWDDALLDGVARLHVSGYTLFSGQGLALARSAMERAAGLGVAISVDPASTGPLRAFGVERFLAETALAGLVFPNLVEALLLSGRSDARGAAETLSERYGTAVVKVGPDGALLAGNGRILARSPGLGVTVTDSTGAGDAFAAGYLVARMAGAGDEISLVAGCRAGAEAVTTVGGRPQIRHSPDSTANELYPIDTN
ncbi:sugar kinase [Spongiactinospora sp. TRM90649]|uniref:carbohydrate kinase family protein n=1 Tax=Spongiactinospora sp. TRM90649 TaxID=3031114 RepID=UPI0023F61807|nr:sugar kinase [Spongiactinospora sp. TRM90649]MDF5752320.1 sugar kinase [Spongiactinospora sp. TRM90649]